jgi:hypothetical protein
LAISTCWVLKVSRDTVPRSRMPSMKMLPCVSKPRMKMESPVAVLPFSPNRKVTPGVLRSACDSVVAPCCCNTCWLTTAMVWGVSTRACVSLGDADRCTLMVSSSGAATDTFGSVFASSLAGVDCGAVCACAATAPNARLTAIATR